MSWYSTKFFEFVSYSDYDVVFRVVGNEKITVVFPIRWVRDSKLRYAIYDDMEYKKRGIKEVDEKIIMDKKNLIASITLLYSRMQYLRRKSNKLQLT